MPHRRLAASRRRQSALLVRRALWADVPVDPGYLAADQPLADLRPARLADVAPPGRGRDDADHRPAPVARAS
jgi:hypothetical protein